MSMALHQFRYDLLVFWRNGQARFFTVLMPLIFLVISLWMLEHMLADPDTRTPSLRGLWLMILGLAVYFLSPKTKAA